MAVQELVRLANRQNDPVVAAVNRLTDMQLGNVGTRSRLVGHDGTRKNIAGGASIATGEYAQHIQSVASGGPHLAVLHSTTANGATVVPTTSNAVLLVRDDYTFVSTMRLATLTTAGDMLYGTGSGVLARLPIGTARQGLLTNAGATAPEWGASLQSLMTAQGDIVQASAANTPARLAIGTARQNLQVNAGATALNYVSSLQSLMTTTGDIVYASSANTPSRLAVGTSSQVLLGGTTPVYGQVPTAAIAALTDVDPPAAQQLTARSIAKGWAFVPFVAGVPTMTADYNVSGVNDNGAGDLTVLWDRDFDAANYAALVTCFDSSNRFKAHVLSKAVGSTRVQITASAADVPVDLTGGLNSLDIATFGMAA